MSMPEILMIILLILLAIDNILSWFCEKIISLTCLSLTLTNACLMRSNNQWYVWCVLTQIRGEIC